jgi:hypothetical protein
MATAQHICTVKLIRDNDAESPRSWDNLGTMACAHKRYNLGDEDGTREALQIIYKHLSDKQLDEMGFDDGELPDIQAALEKTGQVIMLPLYLYDHSGITMSTSSFSCRWDSGQVGFIYVTKEKVRKEYGWKLLTKERIAKIEAILKGEVEVYDQYLTGDVWGFEVIEDDKVDSCWGFFGSSPLENGILNHLSDRAAELVKAGQYEVRY